MSEKDWRIRLKHILRATDHVIRKTSDISKDDYIENEDLPLIVERNIEIIAEAIKKIPQEVKEQYSEIPWRKIVNTRNFINHDYDDVEPDIVWNIVKEGIPELKQTILKIQERYGRTE